MFDQLYEKINQAHNIALFGHKNIDGDSLGSILFMGKLLKKLGKNVKYFTPDVVPHKLNNISDVFVNDEFDYGKYDLIFFLDFSSYDRIDKFTASRLDYFMNNYVVIIDHHISNQKIGNLEFIDTTASSNCEYMFEIFGEKYKDLIDGKMATFLLLGTITDTGNFLYEKNSKRTFEIVSKLLEIGADKKKIVDNIFRNNSYSSILLLKEILNNIGIKGKIIYSYIDSEYLKKNSIDPEEVYVGVSYLQNILEYPVSLFFTKNIDIIKCSLRSRGDINVAEVASKFSGGGHVNAAGCKFDKNSKIEDNVDLINSILEGSQK